MATWQNILVGLDLHHGDRIASGELEPASKAALLQAAELAEVTGASLTLCSVLEISEQAFHLIEVDKENAHRTVEDVAAADLDKLAADLASRGLKVTTRLLVGKSSDEIGKEAVRGKYDLVVVGTRKRSSTSRALFGSTCNKLIRICPMPVWVVKPDEVRDVREVLVASDFSDIALKATKVGVAIAKWLNAKLFVTHALEFPFEAYLHTAGVSEIEVNKYRRRMHEEAQQNLEQQLSLSDHRTLQQGAKIEILEGAPDAVIPKVVDEEKIDVLVIASHGRSGFSGLLLGNTAERLLPHVHCSLLVIKPDDFVSPIEA